MSSRILLQPYRAELIERHSRFIGIGYPCHSLDDFKQRKAELETEFPDASHITFAYKFFHNEQLIQRFSDAGEPSGTAGKPIFMHIEGHKLINLCLFVVRYFGGTKLGAGGLVRAYGNTAKQWIGGAPLAEFIEMVDLTIRLPYSEQNRLEYQVRKSKATITHRDFADILSCIVHLPLEEKDAFLKNLEPYLLDP
ncbi:MAG: IMPACT family protein [Proteobacteria bacterium]|nr:IMPACT family protein [Pseudomonadota bacterium]